VDNRRDRGSVPPLQGGPPGAQGGTRAHQPVHAARRCRTLSAGNRCRSQQGDARFVRRGGHTGKNGCTRRATRAAADQDDRPLPYQSKESRRTVEENHGGQVPRTRETLEALPGVGRKTANVVLNVAFGQATIAVDTHIFRVGNRTGMATGKTPLEVETKLDRVVPADYKRHAHHWLILHGRYVCVARRPLCEKCLVADLCKWPAKTVVHHRSAER